MCSKFTGEHPCQSNFIEITLRHECSLVNLLHIFRTPFLKKKGLLLKNGTFMIPEMNTWNFPPTWPIHLQNIYINDKFLASTLLFYTGITYQNLGKSDRVCFKLALHWSQQLHQKQATFFHVEFKIRRWRNGPMHTPIIVMVTRLLWISKLK